jgi:hypothetical protein
LPGGYIPDPEVPKKIESLDWPSPPYPAAVPELRSRSRSSSNNNNNKINTDNTDSILIIKSKQNLIDESNLDDVKTSSKIYDNQHDDYLLRFKRNKNYIPKIKPN